MFDSANGFWYNINMDTILLFQPRHFDTIRETRSGILDFARKNGFIIQTMKQTMDRKELAKTLETWKPRGCIIDCSDGNDLMPLAEFRAVPHVCLNLPTRHPDRKHHSFDHDAVAIAGLAVTELTGLGCKSFGYVPCAHPFPWSAERGSEFKKILKRKRQPSRTFGNGDLEKGLSELEKPCGIFAANDEVAQNVIIAAQHAGLNVPDDIAVVGVDNDELYCEGTMPGITSIATDRYEVGIRLGEMLLEIIRNPRMRPVHRSYGPSGLIRRGSTRRLVQSNPRINLALEYIRRRACVGPIRIEDVAKAMGCSYRLATDEFRRVLGHTIIEEMHDIRFARICELLKTTDRSITDIIFASGYGSESFAKHEFVRRFEQPMSAWRKQPPNSRRTT